MATRLNVMNLKPFDAAARLAAPAVSLQDFTAELAVGFRLQLHTWPFGSKSGQRAT